MFATLTRMNMVALYAPLVYMITFARNMNLESGWGLSRYQNGIYRKRAHQNSRGCTGVRHSLICRHLIEPRQIRDSSNIAGCSLLQSPTSEAPNALRPGRTIPHVTILGASLRRSSGFLIVVLRYAYPRIGSLPCQKADRTSDL